MNKGERTREFILNRGMLHSSQFGLAGITIGSMAKLCGLSRTGVISHFKNKDDMQMAILDYSQQQFIKQVLAPAKQPDALLQLQTLLQRWQNWTQQVFKQEASSCPFIKALVEYEHRTDSSVRAHALRQQKDLLSFLTKTIVRAQRQGSVRADEKAKDIALELYSLYVGLTSAASFVAPRSSQLVLQKALQRYIR